MIKSKVYILIIFCFYYVLKSYDIFMTTQCLNVFSLEF